MTKMMLKMSTASLHTSWQTTTPVRHWRIAAVTSQ